MKKLFFAAFAMGVMFGSPYARAIPALGDFTFTPGNGGSAVLDTGNITANTTTKTLTSPGSTSASNLAGDNLGIVTGTSASFTPTTLSIVSGVIDFVLTVPSTTGGGGNLVFTFTTQMLNSLVPTLPGTGSIVDTLHGTLTSAGATGLDIGSPVNDSQACSQSVIAGVPDGVACSDTLIVGNVATQTNEPGSMAILAMGLLGFGGLRWWRRQG